MANTSEQWRSAVGFEGRYDVSDWGRVRSVERIVTYDDGRSRLVKSRLRKLQVNHGYPFLVLRDASGRPCGIAIHLLVMRTFVGACPSGMETCHHDGDSRNARLANLRYDTPKENHADKVRHGTHNRGERQGASRLKNEDVRQILAMRGTATQAEIGRIFGIHRTHVCKIQRHQAWQFLPAEGASF